MKFEHKCGYCKGTGRVALTGVYLDTLKLLQRQRKPLNGRALAALAGCKNEAMCNRLRALGRLGFALFERRGRELLWVARGKCNYSFTREDFARDAKENPPLPEPEERG